MTGIVIGQCGDVTIYTKPTKVGIPVLTPEMNRAIIDGLTKQEIVTIIVQHDDGEVSIGCIDELTRMRILGHEREHRDFVAKSVDRLTSRNDEYVDTGTTEHLALLGFMGPTPYQRRRMAAMLALNVMNQQPAYFVSSWGRELKYEPYRGKWRGRKSNPRNNSRFTPEMKMRNWNLKHNR